MIRLNDLSLSFASRTLYNNLNCTFDLNDRVGLVGRNGMGKSTLLKVIAGLQHVDEGSVVLPKNQKIAYLPQEVVIQSEKSIIDETLTAFQEATALLAEKSMLEQALHTQHHDELLERYAAVCARIAELDVAAQQAEAKRVLMGLGFKEHRLHEPLSALSGGWKMRVVLAKLLLARADFYLFDEPTNHLDIVAKDWFINFVANASFGYIIVSHERYTLNALCTKIVEVELGTTTTYHGNFSHYEGQKQHKLNELEAAFERQQREIKAKLATVERFKAKASKAVMAKSMVKKIEKIERIQLPPQPPAINFSFSSLTRPSRIVVQVKDVGHSFSEKVFHDITCEVERGEKVALVAPNGVGKTTLFNLITGKLALQHGSITLGTNVIPAIFEQEQDHWLDPHRSIWENINRECPKVSEQKMRALLGAFLFSGDDVHKKAQVLSGGEKSRVGLVRLLLQEANFLLLDEPTNHLDLMSKDILLSALKAYQGTLLFVSHDHDFINNLATGIIELQAHGATRYAGNYDDYRYALQSQSAHNIAEIPKRRDVPQEHANNKPRNAYKKVSALERTIEKLEHEKRTLEDHFANLVYGTKAFMQAQARLQKITQELEELLAQWEALMSDLD